MSTGAFAERIRCSSSGGIEQPSQSSLTSCTTPSGSIHHKDQLRNATSYTAVLDRSSAAPTSNRTRWASSGGVVERAVAIASSSGSIPSTLSARAAYSHVSRPSPHPTSSTFAPSKSPHERSTRASALSTSLTGVTAGRFFQMQRRSDEPEDQDLFPRAAGVERGRLRAPDVRVEIRAAADGQLVELPVADRAGDDDLPVRQRVGAVALPRAVARVGADHVRVPDRRSSDSLVVEQLANDDDITRPAARRAAIDDVPRDLLGREPDQAGRDLRRPERDRSGQEGERRQGRKHEQWLLHRSPLRLIVVMSL